jgi:hypothetical protein
MAFFFDTFVSPFLACQPIGLPAYSLKDRLAEMLNCFLPF